MTEQIDNKERLRQEYMEILTKIANYLYAKFQPQSQEPIAIWPKGMSILDRDIPKYGNLIKFSFFITPSYDVSKRKILGTMEKEFGLKLLDPADYRTSHFTCCIPEDQFDMLYGLVKLKAGSLC